MLIQDAKLQGSHLAQFQMAYMLGIELGKMQEENRHLRAEHQQSAIKINSLEEEVARLKEQLRLAQLRHFGKKSEVGEPLIEKSAPTLQTVAGYTRKKGRKSCGRTLDTASLPCYQMHHDLSEAEKICCGCNKPLHLIGQDKSKQAEVLPLRIYMIEHLRSKYGCHQCQTIKMAPKPKAPIPKSLAGGSLLTEIIINKYSYHLPLYRQSKIMASYNAAIPDNTLGNWVMQVGDGLEKLHDAFWQTALKAKYLQVDETPVKVLEPEKKGYLWSYFAPHAGDGIVVFELSLTRSGAVAENRLAHFNGLLQTDGYAGYSGLRKKEEIVGLGCMTHARRKFSEVLKITKNPDGVSAEAIERLKPLYALEGRMREAGVSFHTRKRLRQKIAWPILKNYRAWLKKTLPSVPPKSQLANAIKYTLKQWPYLITYLRHGMAEIDTNEVENKIRDIALGKKNWLFIGNQASGKVHALFYSLILSATLNNLNPRLYIHYLITKIHDLRLGTVDPLALLPHTIDRNLLQEFSDQQVEFAKKVLNSF